MDSEFGARSRALILDLIRRCRAWLSAATADYTNAHAFGLWVAAIATGAIAVAYALSFRKIEALLSEIPAEESLWFFVLTPFSFVCAWWVVHRFAPRAAGSGIPQVMAAIERDPSGVDRNWVDGLLAVRVIVVKLASSLLCLAGGGAIGREGPTLQISAALFHFFGRRVNRYFPGVDARTWIVAGASAGLASAFNTPLGGIVYAIEELGMSHFHKVRTALLTAVIISGLVAQAVVGRYLYLGFPRLEPMELSLWPVVILTAVTSGLFGAGFGRSLLWISRRRRELTGRGTALLLTLASGLVMASLLFFDRTNGGPGGDLISEILFRSEKADFELLFGRTLATLASYASGAAGGVFAPSLSIGACIGSKIAFLFESPNSNLLAMLGMIGMLTGFTHTPFTSFILVMEMSDRHSAIFPMMIVALLANSVSKALYTKSFYESARDDLLAELEPGKP